MSSTEIYGILKNGDVVLYAEVENSRAGALAVWRILANKYRIEDDKDELGASKIVWSHFYQGVYEDPEEIILGTTLDNAIVMSHEEHNKDFSELIQAMRYFSKKHNHTNLSEQLKVIEIMAKDPDIIGVAWNQTSLSDCLWNDDENGYGYNIFKQNKHWDVLEKLERNDTFSIGITFEEINEILMKNPSKNKEAYDRLTPIVEQKRKAFIAQLKSKIFQKNAKI